MPSKKVDGGGPVGRLLALVHERALHFEAKPPDLAMAESCDYEWQVSTIEANTRLDVILETLHDTPEQAFAEAADFYDEVLACGFYAFARTELMAARVAARHEGAEDEWLGWRARLDVGLRVTADPRGMFRPLDD